MKNLTKTIQKNGFLLLISFILILQTGCAAFVVGAGTAAAVATDRRTAGSMLEDENIELKFIHKLYSNKQLSENTHINATSFNGWLLLTGEAPNQAVKQNIYQLANNIKSVKRIFNEITIAEPSSLASRSNDIYLTSRIKTTLLANEKTDAYHVKIVTENNVVYLMGLVSLQQSEEVIKVIQTIPGIERIIKLFDYTD